MTHRQQSNLNFLLQVADTQMSYSDKGRPYGECLHPDFFTALNTNKNKFEGLNERDADKLFHEISKKITNVLLGEVTFISFTQPEFINAVKNGLAYNTHTSYVLPETVKFKHHGIIEHGGGSYVPICERLAILYSNETRYTS